MSLKSYKEQIADNFDIIMVKHLGENILAYSKETATYFQLASIKAVIDSIVNDPQATNGMVDEALLFLRGCIGEESKGDSNK